MALCRLLLGIRFYNDCCWLFAAGDWQTRLLEKISSFLNS